MCQVWRRKDRSFWKELDDNLIYYQNDNYFPLSHLRVKNTYSDKSIEYLNIFPKHVGLLNKGNSYISVFIETQRQTLIAKLDGTSLNLRINYRICFEYLFYNGPIYDLKNKLLQIIQNRRLIQIYKNKLIRKYKGKLEQTLGQKILTRMGIRSFNILRLENYQFFSQFQVIFEKQFNISLQNIDETYGRHIFKKLGDFIILKKHYKYQQKKEQLPIYYISIDFILREDGMKGKIQLGSDEHLTMIKCFNKVLFVVISQNVSYQVYEIKGEEERELLYSVSNRLSIKKPIMQEKYLIFTNLNKRLIPQKHEINYIRNKDEVK